MERSLRCLLPVVRGATSSIYGSWRVRAVSHSLPGQDARPADHSSQVMPYFTAGHKRQVLTAVSSENLL
jgi:hypothetical protein